MQQIDSIIFDFGGVILNINHQLTESAFEKLGIVNFETLYSQALQTDLFNKLETGRISPQEFRNTIRTIAGLPLTDIQIDKAWNAMLLDLPKNRIRLLEALKNRYRIFLLSNTNEIHYNSYAEQLRKRYHYRDFSRLFEKAYFSFQISMRKPDTETFNFVLESNNLKPETCLFIDDSAQHINGAMKTGIHTLLHNADHEITSLFDPDTFEISYGH